MVSSTKNVFSDTKPFYENDTEVDIKKLQQFYILKFTSSRLKKSKYNINISLDEARINGEAISINNSQLVRTLFNLKGIRFEQKELDILLKNQRNLKKLENTEENRKRLENISEKIEKLLFIQDLVSIEFENKAHYLEIVKHNGFFINDVRYVPFMASAGMIRKNTAMFIDSEIKDPLMDILENGRNKNTELVPAKWGAYFSLYSSSTLPVSFPRFAVIPDKEIETLRTVDKIEYVGEDEDDRVITLENYPLSLNAWDGQGLISPWLAKAWSEELELDHVFSCAIIRAPFLKGLVTTFDIHRFAYEVAEKDYFTDIYGNAQCIYDVDLIVSESMFKLWKAYDSTDDYIEKCTENELGFSIAKVNHEREKTYSRTSYQFLQVLDLKETQIAKLCEPTVKWFRDISGEDSESMLIYAMGETPFSPRHFAKLDPAVKAVLINPELSRDSYVQKKFMKSIEKKKKDSYMGSLLINANYQFMVSDPYYQACHMFGIEKAPLLQEGEHYSEYWKNLGVKEVVAIRSPIVHHSEVNVLNLQDRPDVNEWYKHIHSGIVYPTSGIGIDCVLHGGSDFDGDLICTINSDVMKHGKIKGLPIVYDSQKSEKTIVDSRNDKEQVESQLNGHNSKVGFATNISSALYAMLDEFPVGSPERDTILNRLKTGRAIQGEIIDGVKGLEVPPFRNHWTRYKKITEEMTPQEKEKWKFNNKILCQVRPAFFRFLYPHYMTRYRKELKRYDTYSMLKFGIPFSDIMTKEHRTEEENRLVSHYKNRTFFLDNDSVVNKISRYMQTKLALIGKYSESEAKQFDYNVLINHDLEYIPYNMQRMKEYLQEYKAFKKGVHRDMGNPYENFDAFISYLRKECFSEISSNESELANYAIDVTYGDESHMVEFAWKMFPNGIIENIIRNSSGTIKVPVLDDKGSIEYLWSKYSIEEFSLKDIYDED